MEIDDSYSNDDSDSDNDMIDIENSENSNDYHSDTEVKDLYKPQKDIYSSLNDDKVKFSDDIEMINLKWNDESDEFDEEMESLANKF